MKLLNNRIFNSDGLMIVLISASIPILVIGLPIILIVGVILVITYWIWKAFNLIFPKRD